jgi:GTP cyclohydrolase I
MPDTPGSVETSTLTSASFEDLARELIVRLGEDPTREGLIRTPERMRRAYEYLVKGTAKTLRQC